MGDTYRPRLRGFPGLATALVPRELELAEIVQALGSDDVRLLTLGGPPGAGKTRMAQVVAKAVAPRFVDGACFVDLVPMSSARTGYPRHCCSSRDS